MEKKYVLAIDQGTTSTRSIIFDTNGNVVSNYSLNHRQIYEKPGWVAHNAKEIFLNVVKTAREAISAARLTASDIAAIGITNQRETVVAWDADTGEPIYDAIVWQCKRTADYCQKIINDGFSNELREKTGLCADPYFSATKIKWIIENIPAAAELKRKGRLHVGTIDSFIIYNLTGRFVTDYTNASRTLLFNISSLKWDDSLLTYFGVDRDMLAEVVSSSQVVGKTRKEFFGEEIPVAGIAGDQSAALFGQTCFTTGEAKNTYGTGCFILSNIGETPVIPKKNLLTTVAWNVGGKTVYALEGSVFTAGAVIEWLVNSLKIVSGIAELNEILGKTEAANGVYFIPAFSGLGAPHWDMYAKASISGMDLSTGRNEIVRAAVESIAYRTRDVLDYMALETGINLKTLNVDGGVTGCDFLMQFQSDILNIRVERPKITETTALGAAYLAGLATGVFNGLDEIKKHREIERVFSPLMGEAEREEKYSNWLRALGKPLI